MPKNYAKMQMCGDTKMQCVLGNRKGKEQKQINDTFILAHKNREITKTECYLPFLCLSASSVAIAQTDAVLETFRFVLRL